MKKYITMLLLGLWLLLASWAWLSPPKASSDAERRPLAQMPELQAQQLLNGSYMEKFEAYTLDQFPLRDGFRRVKSLFHTYVLGQKDNNGIYLADGYAAKQEYPLNEDSVKHALERFQHLYETCLKDADVYMAVVPDKGYYLAEQAGQLAMDYDRLFELLRQGMPWADHIDLTERLALTDYYRTDTHWRQEKLLPVAGTICESLGVPAPQAGDFTPTALERPFYGVYYGQAALPMEPETMYVMCSSLLENCRVYDHETGKTTVVYDPSKLDSKDLYDVYLSGAKALLTIENPNSSTKRELIVFRDSFGSSLIPLLVPNYAKITLVDLRYIQIDLLSHFLDFHGQDTLLLYSTLILNNSTTIK